MPLIDYLMTSGVTGFSGRYAELACDMILRIVGQ